MEYWNKEIETKPYDELSHIQFKKFKWIIKSAYENCAFYRKKFQKEKIEPEDIKTLESISKIPFTTKEEIRNLLPYALLHINKSIFQVSKTSGTKGEPFAMCGTRHDYFNHAIEGTARGLTAAGLRRNDVVQICITEGLYAYGNFLRDSCRAIGALPIITGPGNIDEQISTILNFKSAVLIGLPSFILHILRIMEKRGLRVDYDTSLRMVIGGAERLTNSMREIIEDYGLIIRDNWGSTEHYTCSTECSVENAPHFHSDLCYFEIIDSKTGEALEIGERGELVITPFLEGTALIRYRTGDITHIEKETICGRTHPFIFPPIARSDDITKIKGVSVSARELEDVVRSFKEVVEYRIILSKKDLMDHMLIQVETDESKSENQLKEEIKTHVKNTFDITPEVKLLKIGTLPRGERKTKRFVDERTLS